MVIKLIWNYKVMFWFIPTHPVGAVEAGSLKLEEPAGILSSPEMRLKLSSVEEFYSK